MQFGPPLSRRLPPTLQHEQIHVAVAVDVERIGADDVGEQLRIGADVERLLLEFERAAGLGFVDEQLRRILAAREEDRGKARAVAVERRAAAADEEFPRTVVDAVRPGRLRLLVHEGHVAERPLAVLAGARRREGRRASARRQSDDPHHCASMTSERRKAMTSSRLSGVERLIRVAGEARVSAMRRDDLVEHAEGAVVAVRRGRADAPQPRREEHVALDEALRLQFVAERVDRLIDDEVALEIAVERDQPLALVVLLERLGEGQGAKIDADRRLAPRPSAACPPCHRERDR